MRPAHTKKVAVKPRSSSSGTAAWLSLLRPRTTAPSPRSPAPPPGSSSSSRAEPSLATGVGHPPQACLRLDGLHCPRCGGRRRIVAVHTRAQNLRRLLERPSAFSCRQRPPRGPTPPLPLQPTLRPPPALLEQSVCRPNLRCYNRRPGLASYGLRMSNLTQLYQRLDAQGYESETEG